MGRIYALNIWGYRHSKELNSRVYGLYSLLPVANIPLVSYTLEWLASSGCISSIILAGTVDSISPLLAAINTSCSSLGDQLRDIDAAGIVTGDFLLLRSGALDYLSNSPLLPMLELHRSRRKSASSIMTTLLRRLPPSHHARNARDASIYVIDGERLVSMHSIDPKMEVLALFTENFDYQDIKVDFFQGISASDILSYEFSVSILGEQASPKGNAGSGSINGSYFSVVNSTFAFMAASRDILQRWCYPLVPDIPMSSLLHKVISPAMGTSTSPTIKGAKGSSTKTICHGQGVKLRRYGTCIAYVGEKVTMGTGVRFEGHVLIGSNSVIGSGVVLIDCVIGARTILDANASVKNSILFSSDDASCRIGTNASIQGSLLAPGTVVADGVRTRIGTILGTWTGLCPIYLETDLDPTCLRWVSSKLLSIGSKTETDRNTHRPNQPSVFMFISSDEEEAHHFTPPTSLVPWSVALGNRLRFAFKKKKFASPFPARPESENEDSHERGESDSDDDNEDADMKENINDLRDVEIELSKSAFFKTNDNWLTLNEPMFFSTKKTPWVEDVHASPDPTQSPDSLTSLKNKQSISLSGLSGLSGLETASASMSQTSKMPPVVHTPSASSHPQFATEIVETLKHALDYVAEVDSSPSSPMGSSPTSADLQAFVENTCVEINALKFAFNANFLEVLECWLPLFSKICHGSSAQSEILTLLLDTCVGCKTGIADFRWIVSHMYQLDILEEDDILKWWENATSAELSADLRTHEYSSILFSLSSFIEWLEEEDDSDHS
ncbi:epsilon subunit of translation initiation factor eIF2B [Mitosporidium daphniae]|uniref:Translation initiation factor eIF2B subunit epsilon n=1 Tax=Mitosporidium daphniae TaxID=1485682 RepID=A0A098VQD3_9MICR|nr:epsilon subunit of translation initiation factor eIF2B [Mitosporidium daphniae]KGG51243.1 epsilon subunit of translation initiation factor eIF2B [Mitosporidium daphniae]|eukprot:XP_013237738.1 epsilon subunit of translation initiation factor eIF2B [Mitosporidium daphniae]